MSELSALEAALAGPSYDVNSDETIAVKAEDVQTGGGGIDFSKHYFEPRVGESYLIKILPNPIDRVVTHRSVYKNLPDPERKGKTFHYVSSGNAKTCPALQLFFDLHQEIKENKDAIAQKKVKDYLGRTQQGCVRVQILQSPKKEEIGQIRLFTFSTAGENATVCNLINQKMNPTKEQKEAGFEKELIDSIWGSSVLSLVCEETEIEGRKFRSFTKSGWAPKKRGAIAINDNGETYEFKESDYVDGKIVESAIEWFKIFAANISNPDYDIYKYFAYKEVGDARMDEDTAAYVKKTLEKVNEIIPIIRNSSLAEIKSYGKTDKTNTKPKGEGNVLEDSIPEELQGSVVTKDANEAAATTDDVDVDDIINKM